MYMKQQLEWSEIPFIVTRMLFWLLAPLYMNVFICSSHKRFAID